MGETKRFSHFLDDDITDIPNLERFLNKYRKYLNDDFVLGYYIHLYTDFLWFKYFIPEIYNSDKKMVSKLDGSEVECHDNMLAQYIYNDYTNLQLDLIDEYDLDLKIFYNEIPTINSIIDEISMDKLDVIINKVGSIIENTKMRKDLVFDMSDIHQFIKDSTDVILSDIMNLAVV